MGCTAIYVRAFSNFANGGGAKREKSKIDAYFFFGEAELGKDTCFIHVIIFPPIGLFVNVFSSSYPQVVFFHCFYSLFLVITFLDNFVARCILVHI